MRQINALGLGLVALAGFGACSDGGNTADAPGKKIDLNVAPLSLPGIGDACYDVMVRAPNGDVVWSQGMTAAELPGGHPSATTVAAAKANGSLCASQFGNVAGGDIAYVGPCDATDGGVNNVTLWVENLYANATDQLDPGEWDNPYPPNGPGNTYSFQCTENEDTSVVFNIVIMRDANQGFFDVAVNFANVFCSAKIDTCTDAGDINLLFTNGGGAGGAGVRTKTAVLAFACSGGTDLAGNNHTDLYVDNLNLTCASGSSSLVMSGPEGNQFNPAHTDGFIQWAIYRTTEQLNCGAGSPGSCNKLSWSAAIALDPTKAEGDNCTLRTQFSVGSTEDPALIFAGGQTPNLTRYPVVGVDVNLTLGGQWVDTDGNGTDGKNCIQAGLGDGRIKVGYTDTNGTCFDNTYTTDESPTTDDIATANTCP